MNPERIRTLPALRWGISFQERDYRLSKCLTKGVRSCESPLDTSHYVYPYPSSQCLGELGYSSVTSRARAIKKGFIGSFSLNGLGNAS
jgi:hypothetical protein